LPNAISLSFTCKPFTVGRSRGLRQTTKAVNDSAKLTGRKLPKLLLS
jgi:hypothetical protein